MGTTHSTVPIPVCFVIRHNPGEGTGLPSVSTAAPTADTRQQLGLPHTARRAPLQQQLCPIQQHLSPVSPARCPPAALPRRCPYKIITRVLKGQEDPAGRIPASGTPCTSTSRGFKQLAPSRPVPQDAAAHTDPPAALRHRLRGVVTPPQRRPRPHRRTAHKERRRVWTGRKQRQRRGDASPLRNRPRLKRTLTTTRRAPARNDARTHLETAAPQRGGRSARVGLRGRRRQKGCGNRRTPPLRSAPPPAAMCRSAGRGRAGNGERSRAPPRRSPPREDGEVRCAMRFFHHRRFAIFGGGGRGGGNRSAFPHRRPGGAGAAPAARGHRGTAAPRSRRLPSGSPPT